MEIGTTEQWDTPDDLYVHLTRAMLDRKALQSLLHRTRGNPAPFKDQINNRILAAVRKLGTKLGWVDIVVLCECLERDGLRILSRLVNMVTDKPLEVRRRRLSLPSDFIQTLPQGSLYLTLFPGRPRALWLLDTALWQELLSQIKETQPIERKLIYGLARKVPLQTRGRIQLPVDLLRCVGVEDDCELLWQPTETGIHLIPKDYPVGMDKPKG